MPDSFNVGSAKLWHEIVILLCNTPGINVKVRDLHGRTALLMAISKDFQPVVRELLKLHDINVNLQDDRCCSALIEGLSAVGKYDKNSHFIFRD